jgi:hypothetical protein
MSVILENLVTSLPLLPHRLRHMGGGGRGEEVGGRGAERVREGRPEGSRAFSYMLD